jgi:hypothetical protein
VAVLGAMIAAQASWRCLSFTLPAEAKATTKKAMMTEHTNWMQISAWSCDLRIQ